MTVTRDSLQKMSLRNSCYSIVHDIPTVLTNVNGPEPMFRQGSIPGEHFLNDWQERESGKRPVLLDNFICGHYSQPDTGEGIVLLQKPLAQRASGFYLDSQMTRSLIYGWHDIHPLPIEVYEA